MNANQNDQNDQTANANGVGISDLVSLWRTRAKTLRRCAMQIEEANAGTQRGRDAGDKMQTEARTRPSLR